MAAASKRAIQIGLSSSRLFAKSRDFAPVNPQISRLTPILRQYSELQAPNAKQRGIPFDTLALVNFIYRFVWH